MRQSLVFSLNLLTFSFILQTCCLQKSWASDDILHQIQSLKAPVLVIETIVYRDGGTIGIVLKDKTGRLFSCCVEGRDNVNNGNIFINANHVSHKEAIKVPGNSEAEHLLLKVLNDIAGTLKEDDNANKSMVISFIDKVKKRQNEVNSTSQSGSLSKEELVAMSKGYVGSYSYNKVTINESDLDYTVIYEGVSFVDKGKSKLSDMNIIIRKDTHTIVKVFA
jgi:hypothetical protein